jgi:hypothetical protein
MINWVENKHAKQTADCVINLVSSKKYITIRLTSGAYAVKLHNAERVQIGFDEKATRMYLSPSDRGHKVSQRANSKNAVIQIYANLIAEYIHPSALCGSYALQKDAEGNVYISIEALR